jgi:hypothetical protein
MRSGETEISPRPLHLRAARVLIVRMNHPLTNQTLWTYLVRL